MDFYCIACDKTFVRIKKTDLNKIKKHNEGVKHNQNLIRYNNDDENRREMGETDEKYYCGNCDKYMINTVESINRHENSAMHVKKVGTRSIIRDTSLLVEKHHCHACDIDIQNTKYFIKRHEKTIKHQKKINE